MSYNLDTRVLSRRHFVTGVGGGALILSNGITQKAWSATSARDVPVLQGQQFRLNVGHQGINFTGNSRLATTINGSLPAPILRWREGDRVRLAVHNGLAEDTSIHWHGLILPSAMDGVPGISEGFKGIAPGQTFHYEFDVRQSGTYWYHSHSGFQEQQGVYGAIIIDPAEPDPVAYDREHVLVLSDWTDKDPEDIYYKLKKNAEYFHYNRRTAADLAAEIEQQGLSRTWADRAMWNQMRMTDRDISDVTGSTYTYLMNGAPPVDGWNALFKAGERVRLRIINAAAMTLFDFRIPGLEMTVVAADGQNIEPVTVDEFRIGVAETYDVLVKPAADVAYCLFAQAIDRSGFCRGTLTPDASLRAEIPRLDPFPVLSHTDMGMGMNHAGHQAQTDHSGHMDHSMHSNHAGHQQMPPSRGPAGHGSDKPVVHGPSERGPHIDMLAEAPQYRLDDPGVGLRDNGRRVLTYADLFNLYATPDPREPDREIQLHLNGNMHRYMWSLNGIKFTDSEPLRFRLGERLRITLVNDTMMNHPMHLHGMWSDLETGRPEAIPRKHTAIVQPGSKISYLVTADAPGPWAFHCHLLYHMLSMFRKVEVA